MRDDQRTLHCYGVKEDGLWQIICLDFDLAAQDESFEVALRKLMGQVAEYIYDATVGRDKEWGEQLLNRRAPMKYWLSFYWFKCWFKLQRMIKIRLDWIAQKHKSIICQAPKLARC